MFKKTVAADAVVAAVAATKVASKVFLNIIFFLI